MNKIMMIYGIVSVHNIMQCAVTIQPTTSCGLCIVTIAAMMNIDSSIDRKTDVPVIHCFLYQCLCIDMSDC